MSRNNSIKVGITIGDVAGIGPEIIIKTFLDERIFKHCTPVLFANPKVIGYYKKGLDIENLRYSTIKDFSHLSSNTLNISLAWENEIEIVPGKPNAATGKAALASIEAAVAALKEKQIDVLVTAPINKNVIQTESFKYPGHTNYLQEQFGEKDCLMFMISDDLKIGVVCDHVPIQKVHEKISTATILSKLKLMEQSLRVDFGIERPKIAVLGLNPHAGDNNLIGTEESEIIIPAISEAKKSGMLVTGPYAADGFFGSCKYLAFDGILAMYHDQGLIPFKFLAEDGVNYTAGLPIVRTSPDHGTAEDIAGHNKASEESFRNAIYQAIDIYESQIEYREMRANPLHIKPAKYKR
jgi:4-hydroxythreonine-4-phosphate dehydrogenase